MDCFLNHRNVSIPEIIRVKRVKEIVKHTLIAIRIIIETTPKTESHNRTFEILATRILMAPKNSFDFPGMPSNPLICVDAICNAAAVVNPAVTGYDIKLIRKPIK